MSGVDEAILSIMRKYPETELPEAKRGFVGVLSATVT
jgi:hypothetical protein